MKTANVSLKISKTVASKGDVSKVKCAKGTEASKGKNSELSTPRGFAQMHLDRLRKESEALRLEARAMARLLGEVDKSKALPSEFELLDAEVSSLECLFKKANDKEADQCAWEAMQRALRKRHQAEISSLKTAAKLAGCKGKLKSGGSEAETVASSIASTASTSPQPRYIEVDAGHVSDQSNTGAASIRSKDSTNDSTASPASDEESKSDDKASDEESKAESFIISDDKGSDITTPIPASDEDSKSDDKGSDITTPKIQTPPTPVLNFGAPAAPQEEKVPQPRWAAPPPLNLAPRSSIEDLDPFKATISQESRTLDHSDFAPKPWEAAAYQSTEVQWTPRLFNEEDQIVHTPPDSDDDLVANPHDGALIWSDSIAFSKISAVPAIRPRVTGVSANSPRLSKPIKDMADTLEEAEFAMMYAKRAFAAVEYRHRKIATPRNMTPRGVCNTAYDKAMPALKVCPPLDFKDELMAISPHFTAETDAPLTARAPALTPLESADMTSPPNTARGPRMVQNDATVASPVLPQRDQAFTQHTDEVLQRAMQTLQAAERVREKIPETPRAMTTPRGNATPRGYATPPYLYHCPRKEALRKEALSIIHRLEAEKAPGSSPHMTLSPHEARNDALRSPRPQLATQQVLPAFGTSMYNLPDQSPPRASMKRTPSAQRPISSPLGSHSAPNVVRQPLSAALSGSVKNLAPASHFGTRAQSPAHVFANPNLHVVRQHSSLLSASPAKGHQPWAFGRPM